MDFSYSTTSAGIDGVGYTLSSILAFAGSIALVLIVLAILTIVALWKVYRKAGRPGWAAIVPVYNLIVLLRIVRMSAWWALVLLFPLIALIFESELSATASYFMSLVNMLINVVLTIVVTYRLATSFGKGVGFTLGLIVLPFIFYPILGFGKAAYQPNM